MSARKAKAKSSVRPNPAVKTARAAVGAAKPNGNARAQVKDGKYTLDKRVEGDMQRNADAYINSIFNPFGVRECRVPELAAFPSTVGSIVTKQSLPIVTDSSSSPELLIRFGVALSPNLTRDTSGLPFLGQMSDFNSSTSSLTFTAYPHPYIVALQDTFGMIRVVSMGLRLINTGVLVDRSGTLFCNINAFGESLFDPTAAEGFLSDLQGSPDTLMIDFAQLGEQGIEINWLPLSFMPTLTSRNPTAGAGTTYNLNPTGSTYASPNFTGGAALTGIHDTQILLWGQTSSNAADGVNIELEFIVNYEAIPYPGFTFLHEMHSVVGSEDHVAVAYEKAGRQGAKTAVAGMVSNVDTLGPRPKGAVSNTLGGGNVALGGLIKAGTGVVENLLRDVGGSPIVKQVMSIASSLLGGMGAGGGGAAFRAEFANHKLAIHSGLPHLTPLVNRATTKKSTVDFLRLLLTELDACERKEEKSQEDTTPTWVKVDPQEQPLAPALLSAVPKAQKPGTAYVAAAPSAAPVPGVSRSPGRI